MQPVTCSGTKPMEEQVKIKHYGWFKQMMEDTQWREALTLLVLVEWTSGWLKLIQLVTCSGTKLMVEQATILDFVWFRLAMEDTQLWDIPTHLAVAATMTGLLRLMH